MTQIPFTGYQKDVAYSPTCKFIDSKGEYFTLLVIFL